MFRCRLLLAMYLRRLYLLLVVNPWRFLVGMVMVFFSMKFALVNENIYFAL